MTFVVTGALGTQIFGCIKLSAILLISMVEVEFPEVLRHYTMHNGKVHQWCVAKFFSIQKLFGKSLKCLYLSQISMDLISVKNTRTCHSFATVSKHIPHFYLQYKEGPNLAALKSIVQWFQRLQEVIHRYVTLVCHMHCNCQNCLEVMIISTSMSCSILLGTHCIYSFEHYITLSYNGLNISNK